MSFRLQDVIDCLPRQVVIADQLVVGDVAFVHNHWSFVIGTKSEDMAQKENFAIESADGIRSYVLPSHEIEVIQRSLLDRNKIDALLMKLANEKAENERIRAEQDREEDGW